MNFLLSKLLQHIGAKTLVENHSHSGQKNQRTEKPQACSGQSEPQEVEGALPEEGWRAEAPNSVYKLCIRGT